MTHIDQQVNRFVEVLEDFGAYDDTFICFVADHGELIGDHHLFRKYFPYEGSARVPLILRGPRGAGIRRNAAFSPVVELRDVMPTLLDCAGLPIPEAVEGRSFLPIARGEDCEWRDHVHGEHVILGQSVQWVTDGHEKYVWFSGTGHEQLFDLDGDPQELHDLAGEATAAGRVAHWRGVLMEEMVGREEGFIDGERLIPGRPVNPCLAHLRREVDLESMRG
jgi:arylsulfatase A-like enzyme